MRGICLSGSVCCSRFPRLFIEFLLNAFKIGITADWRAHQGRLVLFLGNKNTSPLVSVQAVILPPSHLKMELSLVPDTIPPRAQVGQLFVLLVNHLSLAVELCFVLFCFYLSFLFL